MGESGRVADAMIYVNGPRGHIYVLNALATIPHHPIWAPMSGMDTLRIGGSQGGSKKGSKCDP